MPLIWPVLTAVLLMHPFPRQVHTRQDETSEARAVRIEQLRAEARRRIQEDRSIYSASQIEDIEARYRSAYRDDMSRLLRPDARPVLQKLIADYPKSHHSGCAVLELARTTTNDERRRYLEDAIASHGNAWCESGVQVGALARALLAVQLAGLGRFDEAERLATEVITMFPGAIDQSGAPLDDLLEAVRLLKELGLGLAAFRGPQHRGVSEVTASARR